MSELRDKPGMAFKDITGNRYGRLVAIKPISKIPGKYHWECQCDCGNTCIVNGAYLRNGKTKSCGCLKEEVLKNGANRNASLLSGTRLYHIWFGMKSRCDREKNQAYERYGKRGIAVCDEWNGKDGFIRFYEWAMNNGYDESLSLDRIDNDGGYSPDNCRWTTEKVQANNRRSNRRFEVNGEIKTLAELCEEYHVSYQMVQNRVNRGWNIIDALTMPPKREPWNKNMKISDANNGDAA